MGSWQNKVVVVTGGNAGFGAAIVEAFLEQGATVVSVSRTADQEELPNRFSVTADVTHKEQVAQAVDQIVERFGRVDVWINNVGKSIRSTLDDSSIDEYRDLMEVNFFSAVNCSLAVLPHLKQSSGSLVQIGSLASKTGWNFVGPYVTSKHALAGLAHQVRIEGPPNVHSLLVCPGPIRRTEETADRYGASETGMTESAQRPGAGVKISGIDPGALARKIVRACETRRRELVVPRKARVLFALLSLFPGVGDWVLKRFAK